MHGFSSASSCAFLGYLLILPLMVCPVFSSPGLCWALLMWCPHPDHTNITGHSLSEDLQTAEVEHGVSTQGTRFPSHFSQSSLVLSCLSLWVCGSDSLHFPVFCQDQQHCLAPGSVSPHLSCYFRFLAVGLLGSCAALNVSGMLSQGDSTRHTLGEVERFDLLCQKRDFMHFGLLDVSLCCF